MGCCCCCSPRQGYCPQESSVVEQAFQQEEQLQVLLPAQAQLQQPQQLQLLPSLNITYHYQQQQLQSAISSSYSCFCSSCVSNTYYNAAKLFTQHKCKSMEM